MRVNCTGKTVGTSGEESFWSWLRSRSGLGLKVELAVALILVIVTCGVLAREAWGVHRRTSAWARVEIGVKSGDDTATLDALADFFAGPAPWRRDHEADRQAVRLYVETMTHWLSLKTAGITANDRPRIQRYRWQIVDRGRDVRTEAQR